MTLMTRRGFLLALLRAVATGTLLSDVDLALAAPAECDKYTAVVSEARQVIRDADYYGPAILVPKRVRMTDPDLPVANRRLWDAHWRRASMLVDRLIVQFTVGNVTQETVKAVFEGERSGWDALDEDNLRRLVEAVVPIAVVGELERKAFLRDILTDEVLGLFWSRYRSVVPQQNAFAVGAA
jgi:hypothetical protein